MMKKASRFAMAFVALMCVVSINVHADLVLTKKGKAAVGHIKSVSGNTIVFEVRVGKTTGKTKYDKRKLLWYTDNKKVTSILLGAKLAFKEKKFDIAKKLAELSMQQEPKTAAAARNLELEIGDELAKEPAPQAAAEQTGKDDATEFAPEVGAGEKVVDGSKVYLHIANELVIAKNGGLVKHMDSKMAAASYFVAIFAPLSTPQYLGFVSSAKRQFEVIHDDFGDKVAFVYVTTEADKSVFETEFAKMNLPFPALNFEFAQQTKFNSFREGKNLLVVVVDNEAKVIAKGQMETLRKLRGLFDAGADGKQRF